MEGRDRLAGWCGVAGVALNLAAVAVLQPQPHCYKPGHVDLWLAEAQAAPVGTMVSAWCFTVGLVLLVPFAVGLMRRDPRTRTGAVLLAAGALLDAAGTQLPIAALHLPNAVAQGCLWSTLLLDATFNGLLGLGLLLMTLGLRRADGWPRGLRPLVALAGLASLPVALQFVSDGYAGLLLLSGPLWAAALIWIGLLL